jgi:hypothetical protein
MVSVAPVLREASGRNKLVHSAVHFMVTLTGTVRPPSIWKLKEFTEFYNGLHQVRNAPNHPKPPNGVCHKISKLAPILRCKIFSINSIVL